MFTKVKVVHCLFAVAESLAVRTVFPTVLLKICSWHVARSIRSRLAKSLPEKNVTNIMQLFWSLVFVARTPSGRQRLLQSVSKIVELCGGDTTVQQETVAFIQGDDMHVMLTVM